MNSQMEIKSFPEVKTSRQMWAQGPRNFKWVPRVLSEQIRLHLPTEELDKLISDRPESCRRPSKTGDPDTPVLTHAATVARTRGCLAATQLPCPPQVTLSLQSAPLHHQLQPQAHLAPNSPAPAQTPPLHPLLPHLSLDRAASASDFVNISTDLSTEVDALDPSIMDFALQGEVEGWASEGPGRGQTDGGALEKESCVHAPPEPRTNRSIPCAQAQNMVSGWPFQSAVSSPLTVSAMAPF